MRWDEIRVVMQCLFLEPRQFIGEFDENVFMTGIIDITGQVIRAHDVRRFAATPQQCDFIFDQSFEDIEPSGEFGIVGGFGQHVQLKDGLAVSDECNVVRVGVNDPFIKGECTNDPEQLLLETSEALLLNSGESEAVKMNDVFLTVDDLVEN